MVEEEEEVQVEVPTTYVLKACVLHSGATPRSGHYITVAQRAGGWWKLDDERVSRLDEGGAMHLINGGRTESDYRNFLVFYEKA